MSSRTLTAVAIILAVDVHTTYTVENWSAYMEVEVLLWQTITFPLLRSGVTASGDVKTTERPPYTG